MPVYATKEFGRFARREGISDRTLCDATERAERGLVDVDLRGGLIKQRVPRQGQGRRRGYRTLVAFREGHRCVFLYGFPKKERADIEDDELTHWRKVASVFLTMRPDTVAQLI